jgi:spore coat protein U-like protein
MHATARAAAESCTVSGTVAFGSFNVFGGAVSITGSISGTCKKGSGTLPAISITLGNGGSLQSNGNRAMKCTTCTGNFAGDLLQYQLYTTASLSTIWIGTTAVSATNPCPCGNTDTAWGPVSIYGQIFAAVAGGVNDSAVGSYGDSITATISY